MASPELALSGTQPEGAAVRRSSAELQRARSAPRRGSSPDQRLSASDDGGVRQSLGRFRSPSRTSLRGSTAGSPFTSISGLQGVERLHAEWVNAASPAAVGGQGRRRAVLAEGEFEIRAAAAWLEDSALAMEDSEGVTREDTEWLLPVLRDHFLFASMPMPQLLRLLRLMELRHCFAGEALVRQGDKDSSNWFVVRTGVLEVSVQKEDEPTPVAVALLGPGATLGEMALLYKSTRTATVTAKEPSSVFSLSRAAYQLTLIEGTDMLAEDGTIRNDDDGSSARLQALSHFPWLLRQVRPRHRERLVSSTSDVQHVQEGEPLLLSGHVGGVLVLIIRGEVHVAGDAHKAIRDGGAWRASATGELCATATLGPGDALAIGNPNEEAVLACLHAAGDGSGGGSDGNTDTGHQIEVPVPKERAPSPILGEHVRASRSASPILGEHVRASRSALTSALGVGGGSVGTSSSSSSSSSSVVGRGGGGAVLGGRLRLLGGTNHRCAAAALSDLELVMIPMSELVSLLADAPALLSDQQGIHALLHCTEWGAVAGAKLSRVEFDALAFAFKPREVNAGFRLLEEGKPALAIHLILSGEVSVIQRTANGAHESLLYRAASGDVLGESSVASNEPALATCVTDGPCVTLALPREAYRSALPMHAVRHTELEQPRFASHATGGLVSGILSGLGGWAGGGSSALRVHTLSELQPIAVVGAGSFARVAIARHGPSGKVVALKKINRAATSSQPFRRQIMNERFVMGSVAHPCIVMLHATLKSRWSLYCVFEPLLGGELFEHLHRVGTLPESHATFYVACITSAFEYLHARHIAYRDLKPENLLLAANGYVKLVDFGNARRLLGRTYTLCGTPEYLAPEMILVRGHGKGVDWWALGVLLYEMMMGAVPWVLDPTTHHPDFGLPPAALYRAILNPSFPLHLPPQLSPRVCDLVRRLLSIEPLNRLGCLTGEASDVKKHALFAGYDWGALLAQRLPSPHVPLLAHDADTSLFRSTEDAPEFVEEPEYDFDGPADWDRDY